ncbi:MAG: spore germination protein [Firmicutes bacterium]|nr:spore germination protein [Bacillota bacterium]
MRFLLKVLRGIRRRRGRTLKQLVSDADYHEIEAYIEQESLTGKLENTEALIKAAFGGSPDLVFRRMRLAANDQIEVLVCYIDGLVDMHLLAEAILGPIGSELPFDLPLPAAPKGAYDLLGQSLLHGAALQEVDELGDALKVLSKGFAVVFVEGVAQGQAYAVQGWVERSVEEPTTESAVRGPKQGFVENPRVNTSMLRRIIGAPELWFEELEIGGVTKTKVTLAYIKGIASNDLIEEARRRLQSITVDAVFESGYIEEYIEDAPFSPFPTLLRTERPDKAAGSLLEGRIVIITEGTPFVLIAPAVFASFLMASEDYYERSWTSSFLRLVRIIAMFISLTLPSFYIAITTFHQEMLPTPLILSIAAQREGVPFAAIVEAIFLELSFELLREAGIRLPKVVGPAISIVGALVLGEAAVQAGLVSSAMVIVVAFTAIASFASPIWSMTLSVHLLRFPIMILAGSLGLFGVVMGLSAVLIHLSALRTFGVPYLEPFSPVIFPQWKDAGIRAPLWMMDVRPNRKSEQDRIREEPEQKPRPPQS